MSFIAGVFIGAFAVLVVLFMSVAKDPTIIHASDAEVAKAFNNGFDAGVISVAKELAE